MMMDALEERRDARLLSYLGMESLEERTVKSYRSLMQYLRPGHPWESLPDEEFLCRIEAARETGDGMYHPTAAGLLMFGKEEHILLEFPEYSLTCQEAKSVRRQPLYFLLPGVEETGRNCRECEKNGRMKR